MHWRYCFGKAELLATLTGPKIAILPRDNQFFEILENKPVLMAVKSSPLVLTPPQCQSAETWAVWGWTNPPSFCSRWNIRPTFPIEVPLLFKSLSNFVGFHSLKLNIKKLLPNFMKWTLPDGRGSYHKLSWQGINIDLIDESYNANPTAMHATLKRFAENYPETPKILVLGDMKELGSDSPYQHQRIAEHAQYGANDLFSRRPRYVYCLSTGKAKHIGCADWQEACTKLTGLKIRLCRLG